MVVVVTVEWWCWGMWWTRQRCWCGDGDRSGGDGASGGGQNVFFKTKSNFKKNDFDNKYKIILKLS